MFMITRGQPPVKQKTQSFLHCRKIAENRRKTQKSCKFNLQVGCGFYPFRLLPLVAATFPKGTALAVAGKLPAKVQSLRACPLPRESSCLPLACRDAPLGQRYGGVFRVPPPYLWTPPTPQRAKGYSPLTILKKKSKHKKASAAPAGAIALTLFSLLHLKPLSRCATAPPRGSTPSQALPRQIPPFVACGDIFPRSGGSLSSKGEPSR